MAVTIGGYKLFAALNEDIAAGFVWLKRLDVPSQARRIVKLTYRNNGHRQAIFCEALDFDSNFLKRYNQEPRRKIENEETSMVMCHWYRARLGWPGAALDTKKEYTFEISVCDRWYNKHYGKFRACTGHPQVVVRVAAWLALISVVFGALSFAGVTAFGSAPVYRIASNIVSWSGRFLGATRTSPDPNISTLSLDEVLAWRYTYEDLMGKPREAVIERFGAPQREEASSLQWAGAAKTGNRPLAVIFDSDSKNSSVEAVKVFARPAERLDVMEVLHKASMFTFDTGTYNDVLVNYFAASTKDGRNTLQFDITERGVSFRAVMFKK